jgi:CcmD family protein
MVSFVTAYLIAWLAVGLYVVRLGARQRRLDVALQALEQQADERQQPATIVSRAA